MKQVISSGQLRELTPEQQEKLRKWWIPQIGDVFMCTGNEFLEGKIFSCDGDNRPISLSLPLLSIGQMIELILEYGIKTDFPDFDGFVMRITENTCDELFKLVKNYL